MVGKGGNLYKSKETKQNTKKKKKQENHCFVCQCTVP